MPSRNTGFFLKVIATDKDFYDDYAKQLIVNTVDGQFGFLPHHAQIMLAIEPGELDIQKSDGTWIQVVAGYGSMVFANNRATVLVESCETPEELDERRAREALERAEERMRQKQSLAEYRMSQAAMARALSRLKFKGKQLH
ncbi:MAG: ATP synthase F1 subunit epsilon [Eubacterium sp.]|jgi:F-type H+-transporting ATPase subunit epsilon|uniref:ATP synthase epsilon chain n=1 Tax=Eubacterium cellulosolvens (strain ATCC 43171 / JCM 9499 / 6) TaxID=633697 RepID=I5ARM4_EUBC6|nr:ATP synthase F1 subunit epsilon [Eubacterium sp.]